MSTRMMLAAAMAMAMSAGAAVPSGWDLAPGLPRRRRRANKNKGFPGAKLARKAAAGKVTIRH